MQKAPLTGITFYLLVIAMGLASFIDSLDFSIANVAIPAIAANFGVSVKDGTWVITLYAVSCAVTIGITGWLATRFGGGKGYYGFSVCVYDPICSLWISLGL